MQTQTEIPVNQMSDEYREIEADRLARELWPMILRLSALLGDAGPLAAWDYIKKHAAKLAQRRVSDAAGAIEHRRRWASTF